MPKIIDDEDELKALTEQASGAAWLALDSEGDGFHRYRSRLCVLQLAVGEVEAIVDPLALDRLEAIAPLLEGERPVKVLHDVSFDAKSLAGRGLSLGRVFDTSVAARFLSEPSTGLAALLGKYFAISLDKGFQRHDWGLRPFTDEQLEYLFGDVRHLVRLAELLRERAREQDILEEIDVETRYAIGRALEPEPEREPWTRIKGRKELRGRRLALLAALAAARDDEARRRDVPPFRVAHDRALLEGARRGARTLRDLKRVRGLASMPADVLESALASAERDGVPEVKPAPAPSAATRELRKKREKALMSWRAAEAKRREVDLQVVLPGHALRDLVALASPGEIDTVAGLGEKRLTLYRAPLLDLL